MRTVPPIPERLSALGATMIACPPPFRPVPDIRCLLAVEHRSAQNGRPSSLQFVFAAEEPVQEDIALTLQPDEIAEAHWVRRDHVVERHGLAGQSRMKAALKAMDRGVPEYLET